MWVPGALSPVRRRSLLHELRLIASTARMINIRTATITQHVCGVNRWTRSTYVQGRPGRLMYRAGYSSASYTAHFDDYEEQVRNPRTQLLTSPSYHRAVLLVEA